LYLCINDIVLLGIGMIGKYKHYRKNCIYIYRVKFYCTREHYVYKVKLGYKKLYDAN